MIDFRLIRGICFIMVLFLVAGANAQTLRGKYPISHFTPSMYQAGNQNIDFAQNRDMTLFVANNLGVLSYNGSSWKKQASRTGKKKRSLAFDEKTNTLYVGSQGEFGYFKNNWEYESLNDIIPQAFRNFDEVWDVYILNQEVLFCTFQGIYVFDGHSISVLQHDDGLARTFMVNNMLFVQSQQGILLEIVNGQLVPSSAQIQTDQVVSGILNEDEGLLIFYNSGLIELSTPIGMQVRYKKLIQALQGSYVNHVLQLSDNRLAISTQTAGLFLFDPRSNIIENITTRDGLASNACLRSFQDFSGNLWLGLQNGISMVPINSPMRLINREIQLQGSGYEVFETSDGFYFTTSNGIYYAAHDESVSHFIAGTEGPSYGLQEISGKVYAGHHTGLFLLQNGEAQQIAESDGLWRIKQLRSNPQYAIGGSYSGLHIFELDASNTLKYSHKVKGFDESSRFFEEGQQGEIIVGQYYKGLFKLNFVNDFKEVTVLDIIDQKGSQNFEQILLSRVDEDLIVASKTGLFKLDPKNGNIAQSDIFSKYFKEEQVYLFEQDDQKNVHVVAENTIGYFKQVSFKNYVFVPSSLHFLRYHLNNDLLNISSETKNGVLFSSNEGFIYYNPKLEDQGTLNQPIHISKVYSVTQETALYQINPFEQVSQDVQEIEVNTKDKVLQIDVESFEFNGGYNQEFRYFMNGFDNGYSEWTTSWTKEYSNLEEGDYEFSVQSKNHLGEVDSSKILIFHVNPPLHRTILAKMFYTSFSLLLLYLLYNYQKRRYKLKTKEIEKISQQEFIELEKKKERELLQLQEKQLEDDLGHVNNLLAASTMNLVVKNEFIESIKEELNEVKQIGKDNRIKRALEGIVKGIDSTLRLQEDWEQFELHFDKVHGDFLTRMRDEYFDLSPNEQKLCALLRLNLNTKDISNLMSISLRGVEVARYRLRKKLKLQKGQNLAKFILEF